MKKKIVERLQTVKPMDKTGVVELYLTRAEKLVENLQQKFEEQASNYESEMKEAHYESYSAGIVHRKCF